MNRREFGFLIAGVVIVIAFRIIIGLSRPAKPPTIAGQEAPVVVFKLDFAKRYKVSCGSSYGNEAPLLYDNVKFLGFVGNNDQPRGSYSYDYFDRWIVLELTDGRKVFLPLNSIRIIEEVKEAIAS